jgi:vanadium chloroperoxidase
VSDGKAYGLTVAEALLADRSADPGAESTGYIPSTAPGHHRPDPDNPGQGFHAPFYGERSKCFSVGTRHALDKPPTLGEPDYRKALRQVRVKGIAPELVGTIPPGGQQRTEDETHIGLFWAYDGAKGLGTPPRRYNQIIRQVAAARGNDAAANARLFAMVNVAMADAGILAWEQKYIHDLWRPVVGIRLDDQPGFPKDKDGNWLPLGAPKTNEPGKKNFTPPFPAYPSGHATFGAAAFQITRLFYGVTADGPDSLARGLTFVSEELNGVNTDNKGVVRPLVARTYPDGLWGMIQENSISRVFLGVHWVFDGYLPGPAASMNLAENIGGVPLGLRIAEDISRGGLKKSSV